MKKIVSMVVCLVLIFSLCACSLIGNTGGFDNEDPSDNPDKPPIISDDPVDTPTDPSDNSGNNTTDPSDTPIEPSEKDPDLSDTPISVNEELEIYNALFNSNNKIEISLDISDSEFAKLQKDYEKYTNMGSKSPIYRRADFYITITTSDGVKEYKLAQVGVRMKGNTSRSSFWSENDGMYNLVHFKLDFGETFDDEDYYGEDAIVWENSAERKERKNRTFATLEKLDLKWNRNFDSTNIREGYMYDYYRECGVIVPRTNLASVDISSDHVGVFRIYEPVDKIFLEKNLPEDAVGGDLYKLGWTNDGATFTSFSSYGVEDEDKCRFYNYDLKTNKKKSDHSSLKRLIEGLNSSELTKEGFEELVDIDNFLAYCAVSYIIGNPDDLRNNYNNTYVYFRKDTGKMILIPYDMDRGFGINTWNPFGNSMTTDNPLQARTAYDTQRNPLFYKSVVEGGFFVDEYIDEIKAVSQSNMLELATFEKAYNTAKELYEKDIRPSKDYHNANKNSFYFDLNKTCDASGSSNMSFKDYITAKLNYLNTFLSGEILADLAIRGDFTGWNIDNNYLLEQFDGEIYSIRLSKNQTIIFKIYDRTSDKWYGADSIDKDCSVEYESVTENRDIKLLEGDYIVYFNVKTRIINIEKQ